MSFRATFQALLILIGFILSLLRLVFILLSLFRLM